MSYETYYDRYKELRGIYKIATSTYDILTSAERKLPLGLQEVAIRNAMEAYDVVVVRTGSGYAHVKYRVLKNAPGLSMKDLAIICDRGNLCFGYRVEGGFICVHTD